MKFDKYKLQGAYHWSLYGRDPIYTGHVDKVLSMDIQGEILDIGAGDGLITSKLNATGIDDNELAVRLAQEKGVDVSFGSAYFLSGYYDSVLMLDVLEHLEDPLWALEEVKKVLKPGGLLYIVTPPALESGVRDKYHVQEWTEKGLIAFMSDFECISIETVGKYVRMYAIFKMK